MLYSSITSGKKVRAPVHRKILIRRRFLSFASRVRLLRPLSERIIGIFFEARKAVANIASLCEPSLDAESGKIPILSDSSVEEASPAILSFSEKKGNEERQEFCGEALRVNLYERVLRKHENIFSQRKKRQPVKGGCRFFLTFYGRISGERV